MEPLSVPYASQVSAPWSTHLSEPLSEFCGERPTRLVICFVNLPRVPEIEKLCFGEGGGSAARRVGTRSMTCPMPTASSAYVLAVRMGGNGPFVAGLVTVSTLLGMVSVPLWLALGGLR